MDHRFARSAAMLARYMAPLRGRVALLGALLIGSTGLQLAAPQLVRRFIDEAAAGEPIERLYVLAALFILAAAVAQAAMVASAYLSEWIGWTSTNALRSDLFRHCLRLEMSFHHHYTPGQLIERVDGDVTALSQFFSQFVLRIVGGLLLLAGVLILLALDEPRIGVPLILWMAAAFVAIARARALAVPFADRERESSADVYGFIEERLGGIDDIRANGSGDYVVARSLDRGRTLVYAGRNAEGMTALVWSLATVLFTAAYVMVLGIGAFLYLRGDATLGTVYLGFQYTQILRHPLEQLANQLREFQHAAASIGRAARLLDVAPSMADGMGTEVRTGAAALELDGVSFSYDGAEQVIRDVSFRLEPGRVLAVVGRTGCGKSTLARLIARLHDPDGGSIRLDGVDLRELSREALLARVGVVTQEVEIMAGTLRENITLFDSSIPDGSVRSALDALGLSEWAERRHAGLDTPLGAGGSGLSSGETQLIALARMFLRNPGIIVLDEASSRLDPATERLLEHAVSRLLEGRTAVLIAHRLGTLERADEVMVMEAGGIVEHGDRAHLAADPASRYGRLLRTSQAGVPA